MPRKFQVIFRAEARIEAIEAACYISEHSSPEVAAHWYDRLEEAIKSLGTWPRRCPAARESSAVPNIELRQLVFNSFRLIFTIRARQVHILHVRHVAMRNLEHL